MLVYAIHRQPSGPSTGQSIPRERSLLGLSPISSAGFEEAGNTAENPGNAVKRPAVGERPAGSLLLNLETDIRRSTVSEMPGEVSAFSASNRVRPACMDIFRKWKKFILDLLQCKAISAQGQISRKCKKVWFIRCYLRKVTYSINFKPVHTESEEIMLYI